jgi:hypothetical protein
MAHEKWTEDERNAAIDVLYKIAWADEEPQFLPKPVDWKNQISIDHITPLETERAIDLACQRNALRDALELFLIDPRFQVSIGGNPNAVEKMCAQARAALAKCKP